MAKFAAVLALIIGLATPAAAVSDLGPAIGAKAPSLGMPLDSAGVPRSLPSLTGKNGIILFFFRSAAWCPFCQAQLMELNGGISEIAKRGYSLAGLSTDQPAVQAAFIADRNINYTLLSDPKSEIIDRYNLRDPQYKPGSRAHGVPRPIILVLDRDGVVKAKLYEEKYVKRPPLGLLLETLDKIGAP